MGVFVIAEAGVNHNGDVGRARGLIDAAAAAGADAVKFQTFDADALAVRDAPTAAYQRARTGEANQHAMLKSLELSRDAHRTLKSHAEAQEIAFLSSAFDIASLRFLTDELGLGTLKLGSGELTNGPLLVAAGRTGKKVILSTGMANLDEIDTALGVLAFGYAGTGAPDAVAFAHAPRAALRDTVILLHCTSAYPAAPADANLRAMATMRDRFGLPVGYSDHTTGLAVSVAAVALGAVAIEKHFTLDRSLPGPDHAASLEPGELAALVRAIRDTEASLGDAAKRPVAAEADTAAAARKSLVAARAVRRGEVFDERNLAVMRPGTGISPMEYWTWLGRTASRDYRAGEAIAP